MIVYCILNTVNGKRYIGITSMTLAQRWAKHMWCARNGSQYLLHKAMRKYGVKAFFIEDIAHVVPGGDYAALCDLEREMIAQERTKTPHGYNLTDGGEGTVGVKRSDQWRERQTEAKAVYWTDEKRAEQADRVRGIKQSDETKQKRLDYWTPERRAAMADAKRGQVMSDEAKAKASAKLKGRKPHPNAIAALREAWDDPERREARIVNMKAGWTPEQRVAAAKRMSVVGKARQAQLRAKRMAS